jgi:hypothetical protein
MTTFDPQLGRGDGFSRATRDAGLRAVGAKQRANDMVRPRQNMAEIRICFLRPMRGVG